MVKQALCRRVKQCSLFTCCIAVCLFLSLLLFLLLINSLLPQDVCQHAGVTTQQRIILERLLV